MGKSEEPLTIKNAILWYLLLHSPSNIDEIQAYLKKRFPDTYRKNSNLTMVHRHLKHLISWHFIESYTQSETLYSVTEAFRKTYLWEMEKAREENKDTPPPLDPNDPSSFIFTKEFRG